MGSNWPWSHTESPPARDFRGLFTKPSPEFCRKSAQGGGRQGKRVKGRVEGVCVLTLSRWHRGTMRGPLLGPAEPPASARTSPVVGAVVGAAFPLLSWLPGERLPGSKREEREGQAWSTSCILLCSYSSWCLLLG